MRTGPRPLGRRIGISRSLHAALSAVLAVGQENVAATALLAVWERLRPSSAALSAKLGVALEYVATPAYVMGTLGHHWRRLLLVEPRSVVPALPAVHAVCQVVVAARAPCSRPAVVSIYVFYDVQSGCSFIMLHHGEQELHCVLHGHFLKAIFVQMIVVDEILHARFLVSHRLVNDVR